MANERKVGLKIEVDGEKEYKQAISELNKGNQVLASELRKVSEQYKGNEGSIEALNAKGEVLQKQLQQQQDKVSLLQDALKNAARQYGEADKRTQEWQIKLNNAEREQIKLERALEETTDALNDEGEAAEDTGESLDDASGKTSIFAGVLKGNLVSDAIGAAIDGLKRLGEKAIEFGKRVIDSYGELEQNLGGSESVFGEYAESIKKTSETAYSSIGASQSEYLATANKIGALLQGSGVEVERSMELTVQAIQRAADAASVMGIDTSAALEAVTGAAKGNYTMMDNLGVKMDATTLKAYALEQGMAKTWEEMSNADKAELAMKYFFEQTEQYAGNFESEARETISGSIGMMQASIETWIAGLGDSEADIGQLTRNVIDSFETVVTNTVPIVENVINSVPEIYDSIISAVAERSPELAGRLEAFISPLGDILGSLRDLGVAIWPIVEPVLDDMAWAFRLIADVLAEIVEWAQRAVEWLTQVGDWMNQVDQNWQLNDSSGYYVDEYNPAFAGYNAAGDSNWRGGLTWVGEGGPELVRLPRGSQIYSNQESRQMAATAAGGSADTRALEASVQENTAMLRAILSELGGMRIRGRMLYG